MADTRKAAVGQGDVVVLVGTMKGAFLARAGSERDGWELAGPWFQGEPVYALAYDARAGRRRLWAAPASWHWGPNLRWSDDFGATWSNPESIPVRYPEDTGLELTRIWQIEPGREAEPDTLYCGVEPAALFESRDAGESWSLVRGLFDHPHRAQWQPGGGGLCLHTILPHPSDRDRMWVAISTGGVYRTEDGGRSWMARNAGIAARFLPFDDPPEFGQCVHKMGLNPARPDTLFLQHHWGVYRSDDAGDSWADVGGDLPSDFGFPLVVHPNDPDTVYVLPLESDMVRLTPAARCRVYRSRDGGASWAACEEGLPQREAWLTVLRDGFTTDGLDPAGLYFGTRTGEVFASVDDGDRWRLLHEHLPPVLAIRAARLAG